MEMKEDSPDFTPKNRKESSSFKSDDSSSSFVQKKEMETQMLARSVAAIANRHSNYKAHTIAEVEETDSDGG